MAPRGRTPPSPCARTWDPGEKTAKIASRGGSAARVGSPGRPSPPLSSQRLLRLAEQSPRAPPGRARLRGPLAAAGPQSHRAPGAGPARPPNLTPPHPPGLRGRAAPRPPPSSPAAGPGRARAVPGGRRAPRPFLPALGPPRATAYRREEPAERSRAPRRPGVGVTPQHPWGGGVTPRPPPRPHPAGGEEVRKAPYLPGCVFCAISAATRATGRRA